MLIAATVIGAKDCYFYIRDEYPEIRLFLNKEIKKVKLYIKNDEDESEETRTSAKPAK